MMNLDEILRGIGSQMAGGMPNWTDTIGAQQRPQGSWTDMLGPWGQAAATGGNWTNSLLGKPSTGSWTDNVMGRPTQAAMGHVNAATNAQSLTGSTLSDAGGADQNVLQWQDKINSASARTGVPAEVIAGIMHIESHGDQHARSPQGATSLMQVMPFHFKAGENPFDPDTNINRGAEILAQNYARYGDWDKAAAAYFGAIDAHGNITNATDAGGQTGTGYVTAFNQAKGHYAGVSSASAQRQATDGTQVLTPNTSGQGTPDAHGGRSTQFDPSLTPAEQLAACGPTAASAFAAHFGQNIPIRQSLDLAKQNGWWRGEMLGPDSEVALLNRMGVPAQKAAMDWNKVDQEIQAGRPVIINTPGHYYYIDAKAGDGSYHVGTSGTDLRGGAEYMSPDQINRQPQSQGAADAIIVASGNPAAPTSQPVAQPGYFSGPQWRS